MLSAAKTADMSKLVDKIISWQQGLAVSPKMALPQPSSSHVLAVGCVDARLNTQQIRRSDGALLFPDGKSPVRNIAARFVGPDAPDGAEEAKMLEEAIVRDKVDRIVIMGHTHCGGINACFCGNGGPELSKHLASLDHLRKESEHWEGDEATRRRRLEAESVLDSVENLKKHDVVKKALKDGTLTIEAYLLKTGSRQAINLMNGENYFTPEPPPPHNPEMAVICNRDADLFAQEDLNIEDGKALIYRTRDGAVKGKQDGLQQEKAFVEFAIGMGVKDIVVLGKTHGRDSEEKRIADHERIRHSVAALEKYPEVEAARGVQVHGWMVHAEDQRITAMDKQGRFRALAETRGAGTPNGTGTGSGGPRR